MTQNCVLLGGACRRPSGRWAERRLAELVLWDNGHRIHGDVLPGSGNGLPFRQLVLQLQNHPLGNLLPHPGSPGLTREDESEYSLRPKTLKEYIGQEKAKGNLEVFIQAAKMRQEPLDHVLLHGPPRIELAEGPLPIMMSMAKSSMAGYRTSSTERLSRGGGAPGDDQLHPGGRERILTPAKGPQRVHRSGEGQGQIMMSIAKSSMAGYRTSSTERLSR